MLRYRCERDNIETKTSVCPVCGERAELVRSDIYWCDECMVPLYDKTCECCGGKGRRITTDLRPVFPEERLLLELILGEKPGIYEKSSVWNCVGNSYLVNGERLGKFSVQDLKNLDADEIHRCFYIEKEKLNYQYFDEMVERFVKANKTRLSETVSEATSYIREETKNYSTKDMFVSFSGGKDSTVTSDLVMRALSEPGVLHIFGDGKPVERYYQPDPDDSTSYFLKNAIEDALEEFGDTLETNQKVSVLVQALERLIQQ